MADQARGQMPPRRNPPPDHGDLSSLKRFMKVEQGASTALPRAIGSPRPAPILAEPHLKRRRREDATWQTTQPALAAPAPSPQEEQAGDPVASRIVYAVAAIGVACLLALCYFAPQLVEGLQHGGR